MSKPEMEFHEPAAGWRTPAGSRSEGIHEQLLSHDPVTGAYTRLLRFAPGADSRADDVQRHEFCEEVYIVRGDLLDLTLGETFSAGMYACRPPGMRHGPWRSESGALLLEIRSGL